MSEAEGGVGAERLAVVTGAARRIGAAAARTLAADGWSLLLLDAYAPQPPADYPMPARQAKLVTYPELSHLMSREDPDGFADMVTSFLLAGAEAQQPSCRRGRGGLIRAGTDGWDVRDLRP